MPLKNEKLYVVIERYPVNNYHDLQIDTLLKNIKLVQALKELRHDVFPYQPKSFPKRMKNFFDIKGSEKWIINLDRAFQDFFCVIHKHIFN